MVDKKQKLSRSSRSGSTRSSGRRRQKLVSPPPLPPRWGEGVAPTTSPVMTRLPLSYPSPPLQTNTHMAPLTSTFLSSPPLRGMLTTESVHTNSPNNDPEMSDIPSSAPPNNITTYQNYEAGVAYVPAVGPPNPRLSKFYVSPTSRVPTTSGRSRVSRVPKATTLLNNNVMTHPGKPTSYGSQPGDRHRSQRNTMSLPRKVKSKSSLFEVCCKEHFISASLAIGALSDI